MSIFKKILTVISYVAVAGGPVLAATGVGVPIGAVLGALGVASGAWLHFLDSPSTPQNIIDAAKASVALAKSVQTAAGK